MAKDELSIDPFDDSIRLNSREEVDDYIKKFLEVRCVKKGKNGHFCKKCGGKIQTRTHGVYLVDPRNDALVSMDRLAVKILHCPRCANADYVPKYLHISEEEQNRINPAEADWGHPNLTVD